MNPIVFILDNIRSAYNVGSAFRTCDGAGIDALYLCGITAYPPHTKVLKTSLGAEETVYWEKHEDTLSLVKALKEGRSVSDLCVNKSETLNPKLENTKFEIVSIEKNSESEILYNFSPTKPTAFVFGNEVDGVSEEILELSDHVLHIPMYGIKTSLNVATAIGVVAYEMRRKL